MTRTDAEASRELAAAPTRLRIENDRRRTSKPVTLLLDYVAAHLFEPQLKYERMREELRIRDNNRSTLFRQEIGLTPAAYIRELRFEVACRLLRDTDLDVAWVGELVGYKVPSVFGAAFRRWAGLTPAGYRRQERRPGDPPALPLPAGRPDLSPASWRRFAEGELPDGEADLLLRYLLDRYPASRRRLVRELLRTVQIDDSGREATDEPTILAPSLRSLFAREDIEQLMAEVVWEDLREKPWPELHDAVRHHLRFTTPALVNLLGEKSLVEGREDRIRGVEIARLAITAAEAVEGDGADSGGQGPLKALAWAWLGNARRLALDFLGADDAFRAALQRLPKGCEREEGDILRLLCGLRSWQRRYDEALDVANTAILKLRSVGASTTLARAYLLRAIVQRERGDVEDAIEDNETALELLEPASGDDLYFAALLNLANCRVEARSKDAGDAVRRVRDLADPGAANYLRVLWLEGRLASSERRWDDARQKLVEARDGFATQHDEGSTAVISLDLALVFLGEGDIVAARRAIETALPVFEALSLQNERIAAQALREAAREAMEHLAQMLASGLTSRGIETVRKRASYLSTVR